MHLTKVKFELKKKTYKREQILKSNAVYMKQFRSITAETRFS